MREVSGSADTPCSDGIAACGARKGSTGEVGAEGGCERRTVSETVDRSPDRRLGERRTVVFRSALGG